MYIAADIADDVHTQTMAGPDFWMNDSLQIGLDPVLARTNGYGDTGHEFGFALVDGKTVAYRWAGRRGQALGEMSEVRAVASHRDGHTRYEAAVPLSELQPLAPGVWDTVGISVVVNDSDDPGWNWTHWR